MVELLPHGDKEEKEGEEIEEQEEDNNEYDVCSMADEGDIGEE